MDEPTGNLDHETAEEIQALFMQLNSELHTSIVVVTHDRELAARMDRQVHLRDGRLADI
jgi:lipoprotein-releasing system ATP-binding protein